MEYGVWSVECGVWSMEYGVWSMEYGVDYGVWSENFLTCCRARKKILTFPRASKKMFLLTLRQVRKHIYKYYNLVNWKSRCDFPSNTY